MPEARPQLVILAGPNGAGKSTVAPALLKGALRVTQFVNADTIARGLAGFDPEDAALLAGRIMLDRMRELVRRRVSFAFETTLASRALAAWVRDDVRPAGYRTSLIFLSLPSIEMALARVRDRVSRGGHAIPSDTIGRRFYRGLRNFFELYHPIATSWRVYDNAAHRPVLVAFGKEIRIARVVQPVQWNRLKDFARGNEKP